MTESPQRRLRRQSIFSGLLAATVAMAVAAWIYQVATYSLVEDVFSPESIGGLAVAAALCWCGLLLNDGDWGDYLTTAAGRTFASTGFVLLVQYPSAYFFLFEPTPWPIVVGGCVLAATLCGALEYALGRRSRRRGVVLVGYDAVAAALADAYGEVVCGVIEEESAAIPLGLRYLGNSSCLEQAVAEARANTVVLSGRSWRQRIGGAQLLRLRASGVEIADGPDLYEAVLARVPWRSRHPVDLLLASAPNQFRAVSAIQAIYTNVIGLSFLLALSPFLIGAAIAIAVISPGGPVIERIECLGYQGVPFRMLRFRTRDADGQTSPIGRLLLALNAANLPRLINVVRGEMALFGPPPVRRQFAPVLSALMPAYPQRFLVKPGVSGWSQLNLRMSGEAEETVRLEYDLYYTKMGSAMLDASILLRLLFLVATSWIPRRTAERKVRIA